MKIITVTLNPAFDIHCSADSFLLNRENYTSVLSRDLGGKGVNISKALIKNGADNTAVFLAGNENCDEYISRVKSEGINAIPIKVEGRIRENISIHALDTGETRISFDGFSVEKKDIENLFSEIGKLAESGDIITFTGRNPKGISMKQLKEKILLLKEKGVKVIIDSRSFSLSDILECKPFLIKPNEEEISEYLKKEVKSYEDVLSEAVKLSKSGIENVIISFGGKGALLVSKSGSFFAVPPKITPLSTVGAGDSMIAGFILGVKNGFDKDECLKNAVAFGTAACLSEGTVPPTKEDVALIKKSVTVKRI